ncbi:acetylornithine deacetylase [Tropicimonas isoalkanivorans]|uniref:Acetylornithine deacetylase n=1 Tax=Tropicimonas isoalkanivorans TaxID=441112 RepID=A0A1I1IBJ4_9RHOB|nr:acetylornithine deacetylase [Tropicimonas isoalkanivorans]SFC33607.1 acetylornithine deacetylase [Tropicimonas isoalkanivorans]
MNDGTSTLEHLDCLVSFPSVCTAENYCDIADYIVDHLQSIGFRCFRLPNQTGTRAGIFAAIGPEQPGGVLLSAHLDVVPVDGQAWTADPFRLTHRGGKLYGRGTCDMKGFAAAALAAADRAARQKLAKPLKLAFSYDEEIGCVGIAEMIGQLDDTIGKPDCCVVGEPTSMRVATGHKGKTSYRVTFHGSSGHSASAPRHLNALHLATDFIGILRDVQEELEKTGVRDSAYDIAFSTVHAGVLSGGTALNVVPEAAVLEFEIRHLAAEEPAGILGRIENASDRLLAGHLRVHPDARIDIEETNAYPGLETASEGRAATLAFATGGLAPATKVSFGTEAGFFQKAGIPTVVCGPGNMEQAHKPDEYIEETQLAACDAMLDRLLGRLSA